MLPIVTPLRTNFGVVQNTYVFHSNLFTSWWSFCSNCGGMTMNWYHQIRYVRKRSSPTTIVWMTKLALIARFMGSTWGPHGTDRTQMGPILAPLTLLSGSYKSLVTNPSWRCHTFQNNFDVYEYIERIILNSLRKIPWATDEYRFR